MIRFKVLFFILILVINNSIVHNINVRYISEVFKSFIHSKKDYAYKNNRQIFYKYRDYWQIIKYMDKLEEKCNKVLTLNKYKSEIGLKCGDKDCIYIQVRLGLNNKDDTPEILILSGMHGDERLSVVVGIEFIDSICDEYIKGNSGIIYLLSTRNIWVVPIVNPWGYYNNMRNERNIDVNRDFPSSSGENCLKSESSRMIYNLYNNCSFILVATLHGGLKSITYGKGYYDKSSIDDNNEELLEFIAKDLQISAGKIVNENKFEYHYSTIGNIAKKVYPVKGGFEDWSFEGYNNDIDNKKNFLKCNDYIKTNDRANKGGALTFLIETDQNKKPEENTLGIKSDLFNLIDLDKLTIQPSHVIRNIRMLMKLTEYAYPDIIFITKPPETLYYDQPFQFYIAVLGCYSFSNLKIKLKSRDGKEEEYIYLDFYVNSSNDSQNTIYYQRCSSLFMNNEEINNTINNENYNNYSKDKYKCNDSNLISNIINRNFRIKNKCRSKYQYNRFNPLKLNVKMPSESKIIQNMSNFHDFQLIVELQYDLELSKSINQDNNLFDRFMQYRSKSTSEIFLKPYNLQGNIKNKIFGFPINLISPQDILQIQFSNCQSNSTLNIQQWRQACSVFVEYIQNYTQISKKDSLKAHFAIQNTSNNSFYMNKSINHQNLLLIKNIFDNILYGNIYVTPSEPRTSIINLVDINNKINNIELSTKNPTIMENKNNMFPYFNNITMDLNILITDQPYNSGEYILLRFSHFLNLFNFDISKYNNIIKTITENEMSYIAIISINNSNANNNYGENQSIKYMSKKFVLEMITDIRNINIYEKKINLLKDYLILLHYYNNNLVSLALAKILKNEYVNYSLKDQLEFKHDQQYDYIKNKNLNNKNKNVIKKNINKLKLWWNNDSKDYMDFRLVLVFCIVLLLIFPIILIVSRVYKGYNYLPFNAIKLELKKRFRSNSKIFIIDISSDDSMSKIDNKQETNFEKNQNNDNKNHRNKNKRKKKKYDSPEVFYSPRMEYISSNRNSTLQQRINSNNSEYLDKSSNSPLNSPENLDPTSSLQLTTSSGIKSHLKSKKNVEFELDNYNMDVNPDINKKASDSDLDQEIRQIEVELKEIK